MSRQLTAVVYIDGVAYGPGYETPDDEVAARIKNPAAWSEERKDNAADTDGHGVPGDHEQLAAGLLPHAPLQPDQVTPSEPAGPGGLNPFLPPESDTKSSAVPAGAPTPAGLTPPTAPPGEPGGAVLLQEPPRSGKGATTAAWRAYAAQFGVQVDDTDERGDIIARLKDDGHIQ